MRFFTTARYDHAGVEPVTRIRNQTARRQQIVDAATACASKEGLFTFRIRDVGSQLNLTDGAILYYFGTLDELRLEVYRRASERWYSSRETEAAAYHDAIGQLVAMIDASLPSEIPGEFRFLDEPLASSRLHPAFRAIADGLFHREVARVQSVLERGVREGHFRLACDALTAARNLVSLQDSYRLHILTQDPSITRSIAVDLVASYVRTVTALPDRSWERYASA